MTSAVRFMLVLLWLLPGLAAHARDLSQLRTPTPFEAHYTAIYQGTRFEDAAIRRFERSEDGTYRHTYEAEHMVYFAREESRLELQGCAARPLAYSTERGNLFSRREKTMTFDWAAGKAHFNDEGDKGSFAIVPGIADPMTTQLVVACQADGGTQTFDMMETDDNHAEPRRYVMLGTAKLKTRKGTLDTFKMERKHPNPERQTIMWLSADNPVMIVRIWQRDSDGSIYILELESWKPLAAK